jgi:hypothetical protein
MTAEKNGPLTICSHYESSLHSSTSLFSSINEGQKLTKKVQKYIQEDKVLKQPFPLLSPAPASGRGPIPVPLPEASLTWPDTPARTARSACPVSLAAARVAATPTTEAATQAIPTPAISGEAILRLRRREVRIRQSQVADPAMHRGGSLSRY